MEQIGSILTKNLTDISANANTDAEHPKASRPTENKENTKASSPTESGEKRDERENRLAIRSDLAAEQKWSWTKDPPEPVVCPFCGKTLYYYGLKDPSGKEAVFIWYEEPEQCSCKEAEEYRKNRERLKAEEEEKERQRREAERFNGKVRRLIQDSGLRGRFTSRTFETFEVDDINRKAYEKCRQYADSFTEIMLPAEDKYGGRLEPKKKKNGLFITGSYGTGKTHLASAIANRLLQNGTAVISMTMIDLLAKIKSSFDGENQTTEAEIMKLYEEIPLLIIDDIGSEQPTEWGNARIYAIINSRYEAYMPTIVTTNYTTDELIRRMTPSFGGKPGDTRNAEKTVDRLREMCVGIEMNWKSRRAR